MSPSFVRQHSPPRHPFRIGGAREDATLEQLPVSGILIVEPQDDNAWLYAELLRRHHVTMRVNAPDAVAAAAGMGAAILEVAQPRSRDGGIQLCAALAHQYPRLAILVVTSRIELVVPAFDAGCHSAMVKPIRAETLVDRVDALLTRGPHLVVRQLHAKCRNCPRSEGEAFDHAPIGGVWLMCRPCGAVWLDRMYESRLHPRFIAE